MEMSEIVKKRRKKKRKIQKDNYDKRKFIITYQKEENR